MLAVVSPYETQKCSVLLKRTGVKIAYIADQKTILQASKWKAPNEDEPHQGLSVGIGALYVSSGAKSTALVTRMEHDWGDTIKVEKVTWSLWLSYPRVPQYYFVNSASRLEWHSKYPRDGLL